MEKIQPRGAAELGCGPPLQLSGAGLRHKRSQLHATRVVRGPLNRRLLAARRMVRVRAAWLSGMDTALFVGEGFSCEIHSRTEGLQRGSRLAADMDLRTNGLLTCSQPLGPLSYTPWPPGT